MVLDDGNVALAYDDVGRGTPPVLLIHGMSCNRTHWKAQVEYLSRPIIGSSRTTSADTGRAHRPPTVCTASRASSTTRAVCAQLGLDRPVVIGHSLGGVTAIMLAADPGFALRTRVGRLDDRATGGRGRGSDRVLRRAAGVVRRGLRPAGPRVHRHAHVRSRRRPATGRGDHRRACRVPRDVFVSGGSSVLDVDVKEAALAVQVPTLFLASARPWLDLNRVHEAAPGLVPRPHRRGRAFPPGSRPRPGEPDDRPLPRVRLERSHDRRGLGVLTHTRHRCNHRRRRSGCS